MFQIPARHSKLLESAFIAVTYTLIISLITSFTSSKSCRDKISILGISLLKERNSAVVTSDVELSDPEEERKSIHFLSILSRLIIFSYIHNWKDKRRLIFIGILSFHWLTSGRGEMGKNEPLFGLIPSDRRLFCSRRSFPGPVCGSHRL